MPRIDGHAIRWYGRVPASDDHPDGYIPRNKSRRGRDWGWDVRCSCGWESRTGGAIEASVERSIQDHLLDADPDAYLQRERKKFDARMAASRIRHAARRQQIADIMREHDNDDR